MKVFPPFRAFLSFVFCFFCCCCCSRKQQIEALVYSNLFVPSKYHSIDTNFHGENFIFLVALPLPLFAACLPARPPALQTRIPKWKSFSAIRGTPALPTENEIRIGMEWLLLLFVLLWRQRRCRRYGSRWLLYVCKQLIRCQFSFFPIYFTHDEWNKYSLIRDIIYFIKFQVKNLPLMSRAAFCVGIEKWESNRHRRPNYYAVLGRTGC